MATSVKMAEFPKVISLALKKKVIIFGSISVFKIIFVKGDQWVSTHFPKMITSPKDDQFFKGAVNDRGEGKTKTRSVSRPLWVLHSYLVPDIAEEMAENRH